MCFSESSLLYILFHTESLGTLMYVVYVNMQPVPQTLAPHGWIGSGSGHLYRQSS